MPKILAHLDPATDDALKIKLNGISTIELVIATSSLILAAQETGTISMIEEAVRARAVNVDQMKPQTIDLHQW